MFVLTITRMIFAEQLAKACPKGIDIYYENVGGKVFDAVLPLLNTSARIPVCGLVSSYNATELPPGPDRFTSADGYGAEKTYSLARIYYRSGLWSPHPRVSEGDGAMGERG